MRALLILAAALGPWGLCPAARAAGAGTSAATFLNLGYGARPIGMGEAFVSVADDVSALHYNPAGLALAATQVQGQDRRPYELLFAHALHVQGVALDQAGLVRRPWGLSLVNLRVTDIERRTSETLEPEGSFGASDIALGLSYGRDVYGLGVGATVKYIRQSIGNASAHAYAADFGLLRRLESHPVSIGVGVANLGTPIRFVDQADPLPLTFRAGATVGLTRALPHAFSFQLDFPRDSGPVVRLGMEYLGFGPFAIRAGYRTYSHAQREVALGKALGSSASGLSEFYGMFMGLGFRTKVGTLDYSVLPYGELGNAHRLSFSLRFGQPKAPGGPRP